MNHQRSIADRICRRIRVFLASAATGAALLAGGRAWGTGAVTPFFSQEAESGTLGNGASIVAQAGPALNQYSSPQLEASGHAYVQLAAAGQYVEWTNNTGQNITAINLRSCIPDAPAGGGISNTLDLYVNGVFRQGFSVNSMQNYCYEATNYDGQTDKNPADGGARDFWNDTHALIAGVPVAPGDLIRFQMDPTNTATFYYLDVIDLEAPPAPLAQPANSLSILSYGAVSNNMAADNSTAINNCFNAARAQGKMAWIPPGTYCFSAIHGGLNASGITIGGAGPWYSTLYRVTPVNNNQGVANMVTAVSCTMSNLSLDCNGSSRAGNNNNGAVNFSGNNWVVNNVWIQHATSAFWCSGVNGMAENCRVLSVWSDGGNFNNQQSADGVGMNLTYTNNFVRSTGDDAMAINSVKYNTYGSTTIYYPIMSNITYVNNTAVAPWGGNGVGLYGGANVLVMNNLMTDAPRYRALTVNRFGQNGSGLASARVTGNVVLRCGGNGYNQHQEAMLIGANPLAGDEIGNAVCESNSIIDSMFNAVAFSAATNIVFQRNTIINPGWNGMVAGPPDITSAITGMAIINSNTVTGLAAGMVAFTNYAASFAVVAPVQAAACSASSGLTAENCAEGGQDLTGIVNGSWSAYNNVMLTGMTTLVARVASAAGGGTIEIHEDSASGALLGTCPVPGTGGWQNYVNVYANLTSGIGSHTLYLIYKGGAGGLFNLAYFGLFAAPPATASHLVPGNTYSLLAAVNGKYVTAPNNGSNALIAQSTSAGPAEEFKVVDMGGGNISLLSQVNTQYVCADNNGNSPLIANRASAGSWETYTEFDAGNGNSALQAMVNGKFVAAPNGGANPLIAQSNTLALAETFTAGLVSGPAPAVPAYLVAYSANRQVLLTWYAATGAAAYNVKYSLTNGGPYTVVASNVAATRYLQTGLTNGITYYFVISASNNVGQSADSSVAIGAPGTVGRLLWTATSSTSGSDSPQNALDGSLTTRWSTDASQASGQWFEVDMGQSNTFDAVTLNNVNSPSDFPHGYQLFVSNDGVNWGNAVATGTGTAATTTISVPMQTARYIRIVQTGSLSSYWSIDEFNVAATVPSAPANPTAAALATNAAEICWSPSASADSYNVKRSASPAGPFVTIAANIPYVYYLDFTVSPGTIYYYEVTGTNSYGESAVSSVVNVLPVSPTAPQIAWGFTNNQLQLAWPGDHQGWRLQTQTNPLAGGLGTNWVTWPGSPFTNQVSMPVDAMQGSVFFRLASPSP